MPEPKSGVTGICVIHQPSVYLLGRQTVVQDELTRFLADHGVEWTSDSPVPAEVLCETAGRSCYMSFAKPRPGGNAAYLKHIKESAHGSVFEHAVWNFLVTGVSRSLTHELVRHRAGMAYSMLSQRYVDESVAEYICPAELRAEVRAAEARFRLAWQNPFFDADECNVLLDSRSDVPLTESESLGVHWFRGIAHAHDTYVRLSNRLTAKLSERCSSCANAWQLTEHGTKDQDCSECLGTGYATKIKDATERRKRARQAARSVLPNACETKIFVSANARSLRHFLEQRGSRFADPEIRQLANALLDVLAKEAPNLFGDYERIPLGDGTDELTTAYRKV